MEGSTLISRLLARVRGRWHPLWRLRQSPLFRRFQAKCDFTVHVRVPETGLRVGLKLIRDASWIAAPAALEPRIRRAFALALQLLRPAVFWDIGANIGFYSWFVRRHPGVREVLMFEPDPVNFSLVTSTIRKNRLANCRALNVAVADRPGAVSFLLDRASGATGSLEEVSHRANEFSLHHAYALAETIDCRAVTIDGLIADGEPAPDLIKIDVEGAEHLVLAGGDACLRTRQPAMIIETENAELIRGLEARGYAAFRIDEGNLVFIAQTNEAAVAGFARAFEKA